MTKRAEKTKKTPGKERREMNGSERKTDKGTETSVMERKV